jgi:hypothetical protein
MLKPFDLNQPVTVAKDLLDDYFGLPHSDDASVMTAMRALELAAISLEDAYRADELKTYGLYALSCLRAVMCAANDHPPTQPAN